MTGQASVQDNDAKAWAADISYPEAKSAQACRPMAKTVAPTAMAEFETTRFQHSSPLDPESPVQTKHLNNKQRRNRSVVLSSSIVHTEGCPKTL